jgi:hypothetical protein
LLSIVIVLELVLDLDFRIACPSEHLRERKSDKISLMGYLLGRTLLWNKVGQRFLLNQDRRTGLRRTDPKDSNLKIPSFSEDQVWSRNGLGMV